MSFIGKDKKTIKNGAGKVVLQVQHNSLEDKGGTRTDLHTLIIFLDIKS